MSEQLSTVYEPKVIEALASDLWLSGNYFHARAQDNKDRGAYTIVIPPPNVTAALHLGHALNNTLQDILIRFRRMQQFNTLWMPGTDHAGIATQTVVEKQLLAGQGKRRTDFERDDFIAHVQDWKDEYEARIIGQLKSMGCSCDWERTRFTMDEVCAKAVRANFFKLFKDGLIYRGKRLVNWDPATQTVLADDEVEHETVHGHFWYLCYPLAEPIQVEGEVIEHITVATTRPETMLGDTAIAMNPSDRRAEFLVGKQVRLPIVGRLIPIVADEHVVLPDADSDDEKAKFSTGFLKVTPAHDPDDWAIGQRHDLEIINVMAPDGSISSEYGWDDWEDIKNPDVENLVGMDRFEAREAILEWFRREKLLAEVRDYSHEVGHSYRSHVPIEPYLSDQWYIAVKKPIEHLAEKFGRGLIDGTDVPLNSLAGLALKPLLDAKLRFIPERYAKTYQAWLENLRDWPISRQLWWGHRIPMWSKPGVGHKLEDDLSKLTDKACCRQMDSDEGTITYICLDYGNEDLAEQLVADGWTQDTDVLDTWFSSALWPFSTMGWPDDTPEVKTFYPGDVLCTAREIITLWVSRMVMMGQYCVGDIPFSDVYIHAMIQDGQGRKMSKSLGNGIDPLVAIDSHGADAMRFTLASMTTDTQDIRMPVEKMTLPDGRTVNTSPKFDVGRNFCNKLWNASRFAMMNLEGVDPAEFDADKMDITDKWILSRLAETVHEVTTGLENFKYNEPLMTIYRFFWNDLCDWYLEWAKPRLREDGQKQIAQNILAFVLDETLRLLHPFVPFITEGIFQKLNEIAPARKLNNLAEAKEANSLIVAQWPEETDRLRDIDAEKEVEIVQAVIRTVRDIRNNRNIPPKELLVVSVKSQPDIAETLNRHAGLIETLARTSQFKAGAELVKPATAAVGIADTAEVYVHNAIDPAAEQERLKKQKQKIEKVIAPMQAKLNNENFVNRAKPEVVQQTRAKLEELVTQARAIDKHLSELEG
ncbi:MAG: valine--tRNA ligase [Planctomycetota bacterium]|jgi:valyl-tRNA synthetase